MIKAQVLRDHIAAVSCGVFKGTAVLDLDYAEDFEAETDANFVMTGAGNIVEIQATAEKDPFSEEQFADALGAGAQRHRETGRLAKDGGGVSRKLTGSVVIATHNPGKLEEMRDLLAPYGTCTIGRRLRPAEPEETGKTFAANARIKALAATRAAAAIAFADDSGLVIDALNGDPGIHSARWAGPDKDFRFAMNRIQTLLIERGAKVPGNAARISSQRFVLPGPTAMSRSSKAASTAWPCGRRGVTGLWL